MATFINKAIPRGMPTPKSNQTLICKYVSADTSYQTLHTVTTGKTFYLTAVIVTGDPAEAYSYLISFDGGTTDHMRIVITFQYTGGMGTQIISTGYTLAQVSSAAVIKAKGRTGNVNQGITITGWEE